MSAPMDVSAEVQPKPALHDEPVPRTHDDDSKPESTSLPSSDHANRLPSTTTIVESGATTPEPKKLPPLPYSLHDHKLSIGIIWTLLVLDTAILPLALFFPLWYGSTALPWVVIAITSSIFGVISGAEWIYRTWKLWRHENLRPFCSRTRWVFDFFHISYTLGYGIALIELIIAAAPNYPLLRLYSVPSPTFILFFGILILLFSLYHHRGWPAPFRISSQPKGAAVRPCTYMITEDVMAVDTGLGRRYRKAINERYEASPTFRKMLRDLDLFWGLPAVIVGLVTMVLVCVDSVPAEVAYGLGWGIPPLWAGLWALITIKWVQRTLKKEAAAWTTTNNDDNV